MRETWAKNAHKKMSKVMRDFNSSNKRFHVDEIALEKLYNEVPPDGGTLFIRYRITDSVTNNSKPFVVSSIDYNPLFNIIVYGFIDDMSGPDNGGIV